MIMQMAMEISQAKPPHSGSAPARNRLSESDGTTTLIIEMITHHGFVEMFDACWLVALEHIKTLAQDQGVEQA